MILVIKELVITNKENVYKTHLLKNAAEFVKFWLNNCATPTKILVHGSWLPASYFECGFAAVSVIVINRQVKVGHVRTRLCRKKNFRRNINKLLEDLLPRHVQCYFDKQRFDCAIFALSRRPATKTDI